MHTSEVNSCREFARCARAGRALVFSLLSAGAWATFACAEPSPNPTPRTEFFVLAGATNGSAPLGLARSSAWTSFHAGGARFLSRSIAIGVGAGWQSIGTAEKYYATFVGPAYTEKQSFAMIPVVGYLKARLPENSHGGAPYLMAGAGPYTLLKKTHASEVRRESETSLGYFAALGLAGRAGTLSPQVELRFDSRRMGQDEFGQVWSQSKIQTLTASVGLQFP